MNKKKIVALLLCIVFTFSLCSCKAYVEHSTEYKAAVGTWELNCVYVDTVPKKFKAQELTINKDKTGSLKIGDKAAVDCSITESDGEISITVNGETTTYQFNVDKPADLLHMYVDKSGKYYHYIYINKDAYDEVQKNKEEKQKKINEQKEEIEKNEKQQQKNEEEKTKSK